MRGAEFLGIFECFCRRSGAGPGGRQRDDLYKVFRNAVTEMMKTIVASSIQFCTVTPHTVNSPVNKSAN